MAQNARNAFSRVPVFKNFPGDHAPGPPYKRSPSYGSSGPRSVYFSQNSGYLKTYIQPCVSLSLDLLSNHWTVFKWLAKAIARLRDLLQNFRASSSTNEKQNKNKSLLRFSRLLTKLHLIARNSDWFIELFASYVIGWCNYIGIGFSTSHLKTSL